MVERHRRDHAHQRALDHVGGIQSSAQADFEQKHVGRMARKQQQRGRRRDLEHGDGTSGIGRFTFGKRLGQLRVRRQPAFAFTTQPDSFVEAHEMRRGIDVHAQPGRFEDRAHERDGRAFAVGAGDMDHGRQPPLRMVERGQNAPHPIERQVDQLGVQRREPRERRIDGNHGRQPRTTLAAWRRATR